jgi:hypothetical protein
MELLIDLIVFGVMLWFTFTWVVSFYLKKQIDQHLNEIVQDIDEERLIPLTVEVDQDQYFCYNSITNAFVCQGYDLKEIIEKFKLRYPDKSAAIYNGDEVAVRTLKKQMKELSENRSSIRPTP